ncbi:hypothetical protein JCM11491_002943 [Sporobolomyces phaffii]
MARRIHIYPYRIPASPSGYSSTRSKVHRFVSQASLYRKRHLCLPFLVCLFLVYHYYRSARAYSLVRLAPPLVDLFVPLDLPLRPHNATHSRLPISYPLLPSDDPLFTFTRRRPCNALTLSLSLPPLSNSSSLSPDIVQWISPSPPLPANASLKDRLTNFLESPLSTHAVHLDFNSQTCLSPSIAHNTNKLHQRENVEFWQSLETERIQDIRQQAAVLLTTAEADARLKLSRGSAKRGLVWTAGNADTFDRVLVSLRLLRNTYNCHLPAEIFHFPSESPSESQLSEFAGLNAKPIALSSLDKQASGERTKSFHIKGSAFTSSSFDQVLYLDSDSVPTRSPEFLFDSREFREYGAVFWADYWKDTRENAIWRILGVQCRDEWTMESGQVLIDKARHLDALILVEHWLKDWNFWFRFSDGDKDLLRYAFLLLRKRWSIPSHTLASASWSNPNELGDSNRDRFAGHTMVQFGLASEFEDGRGGRERGRPLFVHGNLLKRIAGTFGGDGATWGRSLHVSLLRPNQLRSGALSARTPITVPALDPAQRDEPGRALAVDDTVNVSPFTGIGIAQSYLPYHSSPQPPSPLETSQNTSFDAQRSEGLSRRISGLLSRGIRTEFWDGHRNWAYVLGIQLSWVDELEGIDFGDDAGSNPSSSSQSGSRAGQTSEGEWERWARSEERAECSKRDSLRNDVLSTIRRDRTRQEEDDPKPEGEAGFTEVVDWSDFGELRTFERRFYDAGGRANGNGF